MYKLNVINLNFILIISIWCKIFITLATSIKSFIRCNKLFKDNLFDTDIHHNVNPTTATDIT